MRTDPPKTPSEIIPAAMADERLPSESASMADLPEDPEGFFHFGSDGVMRSYDGQGKVMGYFRLNPDQIRQRVEKMKASGRDHSATFAGVDGRDVVDEKQLLEPPEHLKPVNFQSEGSRAAS